MKNKTKFYSILAIVTLALLVVGATYAYFQNQYGSASQADVKVLTYTTDVLTFETGDEISITADQESFAQGKGNKSGSTFARATLQANNKTNTATANYYVYLNISSNDFEYSKDSSSPELLLSITDNSGNQVTSLTGLNYITVTDGSNKSISGFDITDKSGLLTLVDNKEISATPKQIEEWNITVTLVNYDYDQNANTGKNFSGKIIIQKDEYKISLADYVISQYTGTQGENNIYYHDSNLTNGAGDNSYRYAGASANVKNYICLGSSEETCPEDNLYRIIGVFGDNNHGLTGQQLVKVIKNTSYGSYQWNSADTNNWATASLNTTLNSTFKTEKLSGFEDKIANVAWRVNGTGNPFNTAKTTYTAEITNATSKVFTSKISLMYVSDYGYATTPDYWTYFLSGYSSAANKDWLFLGSTEWFLSPRTGYTNRAMYLYSGGYIEDSDFVTITHAVRPSFYLLSSVNFTGGNGTQNSPLRIN